MEFCNYYIIGNQQLLIKSEKINDTKDCNINVEDKTVTKPKTRTARDKKSNTIPVMEQEQLKTIQSTFRSTPISEKDKHSNNFEVVLAHSTATPIRNFNGLAYTCVFCKENFKYPAGLKTHTLIKHNNVDDRREFMKKQTSARYLLKLDITLLKCTVCDEYVETLDELFDHLQNVHKKLVYMDVKNHIIPFKFGTEDLRCAICPLVFNKFKILAEHMKTHYKNYVCDICDYGCINQKTMAHHKQSHKTGSFLCTQCNKLFETHLKRRSHINTVHRYKYMMNKCGICDERFRSCPTKEQHMIKAHGVSPTIRKCTACEKTFTNQNALRIHTKKYHLMERRYPCEECEMKFYTKAELKYHTVKHTGQKEYKCDLCQKRFSRKWLLSEHMHTHSNNRRFSCLHCKKSFMRQCKLRAHIRSVHEKLNK